MALSLIRNMSQLRKVQESIFQQGLMLGSESIFFAWSKWLFCTIIDGSEYILTLEDISQ